MAIANASMLDEATAAAEAMTLCQRLRQDSAERSFFVADDVLPQTIDVVHTRARRWASRWSSAPAPKASPSAGPSRVLLQYPRRRRR